MAGFRLKIWRFFLVTQALDNPGAARVEAAAWGRFNQAGRLPGWNFLESGGISGIRVRSSGQ